MVVGDAARLFDLEHQVGTGVEQALQSRAVAGGADRLEGEGLAFQSRVRDAYLQIAEDNPVRVRVVDASGTVDEVYARVMDVISEVVPGLRGRIEDV